MYSLESLRPLNVSFDSEYGLKESDVEMVNHYIKLIERMRGELPCPGDIIEYTDAHGDYRGNTHVHGYSDRTGDVQFYTHPLGPFVFLEKHKQGVWFEAGYHPDVSVDPAALAYVGKREKNFKAFGHRGVVGNGALYFKTLVNAWEYIAPHQIYPGYSTKDWQRQYITYVEKPADGSPYHYYGSFNSGIAFRNAEELKLWKDTYRAVEFPGFDHNHTVVFHYRETDRLISREEWDALSLPLDTRVVNGMVFVKVAYDNEEHMVTVYRFTNSGVRDSKELGPYERAKGTALFAPGAEISER